MTDAPKKRRRRRRVGRPRTIRDDATRLDIVLNPQHAKKLKRWAARRKLPNLTAAVRAMIETAE